MRTNFTRETIDNITKTLRTVKAASWRLVFPVLGDALFFLLYGFASSGLFGKGFEYISAIGVDAIRNLGQPSKYLPTLLLLLIVSSIIIFFIYCMFQGTVWWICQGFVKRKRPYHSYMKSFTFVSVLWAGLFVIHNALSFLSSLSASLGATSESSIVSYLLNTYLLVVVYFAVLSYVSLRESALETIKHAFRIGTRKVFAVLPAFLVVAAAFILVSLLMRTISENFAILFLLQLLLVLPILSVSRIFFLTALPEN